MTGYTPDENKDRHEKSSETGNEIPQNILAYIAEIVKEVESNVTDLEELKNHIKSVSIHLKSEKEYKQEVEAYVLFNYVLSPTAKGYIKGIMIALNINNFSNQIIFEELRAIRLIEMFDDKNIVQIFIQHILNKRVETANKAYEELQIYAKALLGNSSPLTQKIFIDVVTNPFFPRLPSEALREIELISKNISFTKVDRYYAGNFSTFDSETIDIINNILNSDYDQSEAQHMFMVDALISDEETLKSEQEAFKLFYSLSEYSELYVRKYMKKYHICLLSDIIRIIYPLFFAENVFKPENKKKFFHLLQKDGKITNLNDIFHELGIDINEIQKFRKI